MIFFSQSSSSQVNNNGLLSFGSPISQFTPQALPVAFGNPFLAIFWADVDNRLAGDIYYRQSTDPSLLSRATSDIRTYFHAMDFTAQWVFVATWHRVAYYGSSTNKVNTFQAVLTTDGNQTFLLYNYDDIQWPSIYAYGSYQYEPLTLAGLNSGYDIGYYTLPGSLTLSVANLSSSSNTNVTGRWAFKVDKLHPEDTNGNIENENSTDTPLTTPSGPFTTRSTTINSPFTGSTTNTSPFIMSSGLLYPYGSAIDNINPKIDDGGSPKIFPSRDIPLFGRNYSYLFVNNNGLLSFSSPISQYSPQALPVKSGNPFLAIYWADVDNSLAGDVYYRESTDPSLLSRATSDISTYFHAVNFTARWVFVATWHQVAYFGSSTNKVNTFQTVLSTDGNQTFLLYNYGNIQWPSMNWDGPLALAGLNSGYDTGHYTLPGSLTLSVANLSSTSNVNVTGRWAFKVDKLHPEDTNGDIDLLYPYGSAIDNVNPRALDGGSPMVFSSRQIPLFGRYYSYLYVNNNGLLSFSWPISQYIPQALPVAFGNPFLAIFWTDVDNRLEGDIYYRESTDPSLLSRVTSDIRTYFHGVNFTARWVFVATWHRVAYFGSSTSKVNTFQAVLSTDGNQTFLLYNYEDIQWPSIYAYGSYPYEPLSLAGLNSGYDTGYYTLPGSLTISIANLSNTSNVNVTGRWAFKVDKLHPEDVNGDIDLLYPYGSAIDNINPKELDGGSPKINSSRQIPLFGRHYSYLYVNNNGLLSFSWPISQYIPQALPVAFGNPFLAIFWTDVDNRFVGDIYYRESTDPSLLSRATSDIRTYFHAVDFTAQWVFVATWHRVVYYESSTDRSNTFQAVLSTDGNQTFLLYNYEDIQWPSIYAYGYYQHGPLSLAGLNSGYDTGYYTLPGSLSLGIANLANTSNVNFTGRWAFRVDQLHPKDANGNNIDDSTENENSTDSPLTTPPGPFTTRSTTITSPFTGSTTNTSPFISSSDLLYPYGSAIDNINPKIDDGGSPVIFPSRDIPLFGRNYSYLYVNNNGLLSFTSPISQFTPQALPVAFGNPFLAIFWADVNNELAGDIYYRDSTDPSLLSRATNDIRTYFHGVNFTARWVFVATWHRVAYYGSSTSKVNTFQAVLTTDGNQTFLLYNYEDIQWPSIYIYGPYPYGPLALAGLNSGYDTGYYTLPGSLSLGIANLANTSNVNFTGRWAFRVDQLHPKDANGNNIDDTNETNWTTANPSNTALPPTTSSDDSTENENSTDSPLTIPPGLFTTRSTTITSPFTRTTTNTSPFILSSDLLYPYGSPIDNINPKIDDGGSSEIFPSRDIPLFGRNYSYLYVNNNGLLSFTSPISQFTPQALPVAFGNPFLAIFWTDLDNRLAGDIYYRESTDPSLLSRATSDIRTYFHAMDFTAQWVFVATWHRVAYYGSSTNKVNTFQAVLSTDGNQTFLLYNYEDIQWPSIYANESYPYGPLALAGLNSGYDTGYYTIPGSLSLGIANLANTSNVNFTGRWAFRVDQLHPENANGNIGRDTFYSVLYVRLSNIYLLSSMIWQVRHHHCYGQLPLLDLVVSI
ncbi:hypothetical protein AB205_0044100 [Aquarana catesbeiana]|uniref:NIDO domain-containing protein n=1 Tax=Aquarana catesbeiana TaxID=8400 RepID=A0A2G9S4I9_AQUCT|nr:hypothetical protein AB205_0044100 [Aquarana catesbeiana]